MNIKIDSSINVIKNSFHNLDKVFYPKKIALIGATERLESVGRTILLNLLNPSFKGSIYPVNPKRKTVLGIKAYPNIKSISDDIDLAIICVPAKSVPDIVLECVQKKVGASIIISSGFKEIGSEGLKLEEEIKKHIKGSLHRVIGPNCLGVMNPYIGLNATFANDNALSGNIAFISQSGALCTAILDWSLREKIGFSSFVSIGSMIDVDWGDLINYLGNDKNTKSILMYMENIHNPRSFLSAAKEVSMTKPIILIKGGKTKASEKASASHTGALSERDDVLDAAFKRVGILRVDTIEDLFSSCEILSKQPVPKGPNLAIITNAGGPGVLATDSLIQSGGNLAYFSKKTYEELDKILPPSWSKNNPVDILGDATAERYKETVKIIAEDKNCDGILVILTPQYMTDPKGVAAQLKELKFDKPILTSWMGAKAIEEGKNILTSNNIPVFSYPDSACRAFSYMYSYGFNVKAIYETPLLRDKKSQSKEELLKRNRVKYILKKAEERILLSEYESKKILEAYDIPTSKTYVAFSLEQAVTIASSLKFPLVMKLHSYTILHKTDVGGVKLNLKNIEDVKKAYEDIYNSLKVLNKEKDFQGVSLQPMIAEKGYELILGSSVDPHFGPVLLFGTGGEFVEIFQDKNLTLPPLNSNLAFRFMKDTKIFKAFKGFRGKKAIDLSYLETILVKFSNLISEYPIIKEFDINPLFVSSNKILALDARCILYKEKEFKVPLAIRPYPLEYLKFDSIDDIPITIRPIKPEDENLVIDFFYSLSEEKLLKGFLRELDYSELIAKNRLIRLCFVDYDKEMVLIVENDKREIISIGRLTKILDTDEATFSVIVKESWQNKKIATKVLDMLINVAIKENIKKVFSDVKEDNIAMIKLCKNKGFSILKKFDNKIFVEKYL